MPARRFGRDSGEGPAADLLEFLRITLDARAFEKAEQMVRALTDISATDDASDPLDFLPARKPGANDRALAMDSAGPGAREAAIAMVEPYVGRQSVLACDTAAEVVRTALVELGCDTARTIHAGALHAMWNAVRRGHAPIGTSGSGSYVAQPAPRDPRAAARFAREYPEVARIRIL